MIMGVWQSTGAGLGVPSAYDRDTSHQLRYHTSYTPIILYVTSRDNHDNQYPLQVVVYLETQFVKGNQPRLYLTSQHKRLTVFA